RAPGPAHPRPRPAAGPARARRPRPGGRTGGRAVLERQGLRALDAAAAGARRTARRHPAVERRQRVRDVDPAGPGPDPALSGADLGDDAAILVLRAGLERAGLPRREGAAA